MSTIFQLLVRECLCVSIVLSNIRRNNINHLILAHNNNNSIRNKFDQLMAIKEKSNFSWYLKQTILFKLSSFVLKDTVFLSLIDINMEVVLWYIYIKLIPMKNCSTKAFFTELNLRRKKWLYLIEILSLIMWVALEWILISFQQIMITRS